VRHLFPYICVFYVSLVDVKKLCASYLLWVSDFVSGRISSRGVLIACRLLRFISFVAAVNTDWSFSAHAGRRMHWRRLGAIFFFWGGTRRQKFFFRPQKMRNLRGGTAETNVCSVLSCIDAVTILPYSYHLTPDLCLFLMGYG